MRQQDTVVQVGRLQEDGDSRTKLRRMETRGLWHVPLCRYVLTAGKDCSLEKHEKFTLGDRTPLPGGPDRTPPPNVKYL